MRGSGSGCSPMTPQAFFYRSPWHGMLSIIMDPSMIALNYWWCTITNGFSRETVCAANHLKRGSVIKPFVIIYITNGLNLEPFVMVSNTNGFSTKSVCDGASPIIQSNHARVHNDWEHPMPWAPIKRLGLHLFFHFIWSRAGVRTSSQR